jgi:xanthine dehydrogenase YagR molybdenum-binding subunit
MSPVVGQPVRRVDGPAKVTGRAAYTADVTLPHLAHAALVDATIPHGRITALDDAAAARAPGVIAVISHKNAPKLPYRPMDPHPIVDPDTGEQLKVFQDDKVLFNGQPVAVVVAETREQAVAAARLVRLSYVAEAAITEFDAAKHHARPPPGSAMQARGDAEVAFRQQPFRVDVPVSHPPEFHNAMEPHATVAAWQDDRLTLYDKTQWVDNDREEIAHVFGIPVEHIRVLSPFVGGAFGSGLRTWPHVTVAAMAAKMVGRPVKLALTRRQLFWSIGYRPHTAQRVRLGSDAGGRLAAIIHEATAQTSVYENYTESVVETPAMLYAAANLRTDYRLAPMHFNTPVYMRAPGTATGVLALELAMDELAEAARLDPIELRLRNYAEHDQRRGLPWSSNSLKQCYRLGAERFGWANRPPTPGSRVDGSRLIGYGMATAVYHTSRGAASARAEIRADGTAWVGSAASDMGPGTYTAMTQVAADALALPIEAVRFQLGDSDLPPAPVHGGSITMASVGSAVHAACLALRDKCRSLGGNAVGVEGYRALLARHGLERVTADGHAAAGDEKERFSSYAFGAVFAEVAVDAELAQLRVPRLLGVYAAGRIVNPLTAHSQCIGGLVGGLGMALMEEGRRDPRFGRVMNASLADYLVPVNADIPSVDALFVEEEDPRVNPLGVKGLAEVALVGVAPAIVNAVYNATGRRIRDLPVTPEKLLT